MPDKKTKTNRSNNNNKDVGGSYNIKGIWRVMSTTGFARNWPKCMELHNF